MKAWRSLKPKEMKGVGTGTDPGRTRTQASPGHRLFVRRLSLAQPRCDSSLCQSLNRHKQNVIIKPWKSNKMIAENEIIYELQYPRNSYNNQNT